MELTELKYRLAGSRMDIFLLYHKLNCNKPRGRGPGLRIREATFQKKLLKKLEMLGLKERGIYKSMSEI